jgi:hypothetical protein
MRVRVPYAKHQFDGGGRTKRLNRGSRKRLSRISWRDNTPASVWILFLILLLMLIGVFVWVSQQKTNTKQTALRAPSEIQQIRSNEGKICRLEIVRQTGLHGQHGSKRFRTSRCRAA